MAFKSLGGLLRRTVQAKGLAWQVEAAMALRYFNEITTELWGDKMKDRARAMYLKDHVLTVAVLSPVLAQELRLKEKKIVNYINDKMQLEAVDHLRFIS